MTQTRTKFVIGAVAVVFTLIGAVSALTNLTDDNPAPAKANQSPLKTQKVAEPDSPVEFPESEETVDGTVETETVKTTTTQRSTRTTSSSTEGSKTVKFSGSGSFSSSQSSSKQGDTSGSGRSGRSGSRSNDGSQLCGMPAMC